MAEMFHKKAREACGFGKTENLSPADLIRERYRGIRPAPGYPACPDHMEKPILFDLLKARGRHRHHPDRELRHEPGQQRQRLVHEPP
jgi:cobalamin-dependent methionine synthase I